MEHSGPRWNTVERSETQWNTVKYDSTRHGLWDTAAYFMQIFFYRSENVQNFHFLGVIVASIDRGVHLA